MENENKNDDIHKQNQKKIEYYLNILPNLSSDGREVKMEIEDSFENQEKEYEENNKKKIKKKHMSLVPLFIILVLGFNLIIYNNYGDDNISIPFITFAISLYLLFKYVPKKSKEKFVKQFEETIKKISDLIFFFDKNNNRENKLKKYISVSSDDQKKLLKEDEKEDEKEDNCMESPLLNI